MGKWNEVVCQICGGPRSPFSGTVCRVCYLNRAAERRKAKAEYDEAMKPIREERIQIRCLKQGKRTLQEIRLLVFSFATRKRASAYQMLWNLFG